MSNVISFKEKKMEQQAKKLAKSEQFTSIYMNEKIEALLSNHGNLHIVNLVDDKVLVSLSAIDVFQFVENASECLKKFGFDLFDSTEFSNNPSWR